ncbi:hypothetical protein YPPY66_2277, partial [Yersinia pestis PY-66]
MTAHFFRFCYPLFHTFK